MFVSQERRAIRKRYQKPNILRRKQKVVRPSVQKNDCPEIIPLMCPANNDILNSRCSPSYQVQTPQCNVVCIDRKNLMETSQTLEINGDSITIYAHNTQEDNNNPYDLNVESFLNDGVIKQNNLSETTSSKMEADSKQKWCLDLMSQSSKDTVTTNYYDGSQSSSIYIDKSSEISIDEAAVASLLAYETNTSQEVAIPAQSISLDSVSHLGGPVKLKCDVPNCSKSFWTEARLQKHKNTHKNQKEKSSIPTIFTCPVKKTNAEGVETKCNMTFPVRNQLMDHLNKDHSPEEALYRCTLCGRRFFWAGGARAHQAGSCDRLFTCAWAGCGRVFRQPCRLREHARAHTGDRPYPCHYPNCGWAFRSASKLVRHERRHTGERRHVCVACGRAFLRREHLRDHVARNHAQGERPLHVCTEEGCEQTFKSTSALLIHQKKVHMKNEGKPSAPRRGQKNSKVDKEMFVVSLVDTEAPKLDEVVETTTEIETSEHITIAPVEPTCTEDDISMDCDVTEHEGRCARTHCTWPLQRQHSEYSIDDDEQVEQSESSESNIYTVRSDLFLHGNVLINEDSEFIRIGGSVPGSTVESGEGEGGEALGLIDAHPTIDLMQEELMYSDAVDESSFRVFLLNGEELA